MQADGNFTYVAAAGSAYSEMFTVTVMNGPESAQVNLFLNVNLPANPIRNSVQNGGGQGASILAMSVAELTVNYGIGALIQEAYLSNLVAQPAPNIPPQEGDPNFIGPIRPRSWRLAANKKGHHLFEQHNVEGRPGVAALNVAGTPRYYPVDGQGMPLPQDAMGRAHLRLHRALEAAGIQGDGGNPGLTLTEIFTRSLQAYSSPEVSNIRGDVRLPNGTGVIARNVSPREGFIAVLEWFSHQPLPASGAANVASIEAAQAAARAVVAQNAAPATVATGALIRIHGGGGIRVTSRTGMIRYQFPGGTVWVENLGPLRPTQPLGNIAQGTVRPTVYVRLTNGAFRPSVLPPTNPNPRTPGLALSRVAVPLAILTVGAQILETLENTARSGGPTQERANVNRITYEMQIRLNQSYGGGQVAIGAVIEDLLSYDDAARRRLASLNWTVGEWQLLYQLIQDYYRNQLVPLGPNAGPQGVRTPDWENIWIREHTAGTDAERNTFRTFLRLRIDPARDHLSDLLQRAPASRNVVNPAPTTISNAIQTFLHNTRVFAPLPSWAADSYLQLRLKLEQIANSTAATDVTPLDSIVAAFFEIDRFKYAILSRQGPGQTPLVDGLLARLDEGVAAMYASVAPTLNGMTRQQVDAAVQELARTIGRPNPGFSDPNVRPHSGRTTGGTGLGMIFVPEYAIAGIQAAEAFRGPSPIFPPPFFLNPYDPLNYGRPIRAR
jgi:hypothetical protein